jgi:hypothetical protein
MWNSAWPPRVYTLPDGARVVPIDDELSLVIPADMTLAEGVEEFLCTLIEAAIARP